jgi:serine protease SohB
VGEWLADYGLFLAKAITVVVALLVVIGGAVALGQRRRTPGEGHIEVRKLNERLEAMHDALRQASLEPREYRRQHKAQAKSRKAERKREAQATRSDPDSARQRLFVLDFHGDLRAHAVQALREEITAVLTQVQPGDTVLLRLESGGGLVHAYGLAAAQLARLRERAVPLTVCVDKIAASGGYLMACVASEIVAAPFAMLGSIGVVAQLPNFSRLLHKHDIDYELFTAGRFKRTVTVFGRNTDAGRAKFAAELEDTHQLFKEFVGRYRTQLDLEEVATGEVWFGERALERKLVDRLSTSDAWLQEAAVKRDVFEVRYVERKRLSERLGSALEGGVERGVSRALERLDSREEWLR